MPLDNEYLPVKLEYRYMRDGWYQLPLFDWVQSHAIYGLTVYDLDSVKKELKSKGATHFRVVGKAKHGDGRILCYRGTPNPEFKHPHPKKKKKK
jgi:hypothetical protein